MLLTRYTAEKAPEEALMGTSLYSLLPGVAENSLR